MSTRRTVRVELAGGKAARHAKISHLETGEQIRGVRSATA